MLTLLGAGQGSGSNPLLLDNLGVSASVAYSVRKLRTAYNGNAIRIRRNNDNAEQDIGFSGSQLDTISIASFVGSNSAYIVTWYDQSGNGLNARLVRKLHSKERLIKPH